MKLIETYERLNVGQEPQNEEEVGKIEEAIRYLNDQIRAFQETMPANAKAILSWQFPPSCKILRVLKLGGGISKD
ncbi:hypothetical protein DAPPUDRAFT_250860 [Daphnia pulex]|uniref:Uncharacterized protein n=1 Tax=Daphnia pulex TaxID=6669 RepID=E9GZE1_DAPPU|nr:hypothetical protein DAPPUDRAFT_250860 [Daphnia pulex]|eukprot:EFX75175.1 hypothetical protein DAPPUDRAFT_250860 [Daphnia pulex]